MSNSLKFWMGLSTGVAVGVLGAIYGPRVTRETRKHLYTGLKGAQDMVDSAGKVIKKTTERYSRQAEDVLHDATKTVKTVVDSASGALKTVKDMVA
jgi:gas vesicle protein